MARSLKAEWWELWWVKKGEKPCFIPAYGLPIPRWIPGGAFVTREHARAEKRKRLNKYYKIFHIRRYTTSVGA